MRANARAGAGKTATHLTRDSVGESAERVVGRITGDISQGNRHENHEERPWRQRAVVNSRPAESPEQTLLVLPGFIRPASMGGLTRLMKGEESLPP